MKKLGILLLVLGLLCAVAAGSWYISNENEDEQAGREAEKALRRLRFAMGPGGNQGAGENTEPYETIPPGENPRPDESPLAEETAGPDESLPGVETAGSAESFLPMGTSDPGDAPVPENMPFITIDGYNYIGSLSIPELKLDLPVLAESEPIKVLKKAPGRYHGTAEQGNLILAGHNYKHHFTHLRRLAPGSRLSFTDVEGKIFNYVVSKVETVGGYDVKGMLAGSDAWDLTLFTCTYSRTERVTVRCVRTDNR